MFNFFFVLFVFFFVLYTPLSFVAILTFAHFRLFFDFLFDNLMVFSIRFYGDCWLFFLRLDDCFVYDVGIFYFFHDITTDFACLENNKTLLIFIFLV